MKVKELIKILKAKTQNSEIQVIHNHENYDEVNARTVNDVTESMDGKITIIKIKYK